MIQLAQQLEEQLKPKDEAYAAGFQQYQSPRLSWITTKLFYWIRAVRRWSRQTRNSAKIRGNRGQLAGAKEVG